MVDFFEKIQVPSMLIHKISEDSDHNNELKVAILRMLNSIAKTLDKKESEEEKKEDPEKKIGLEKEYQDLIEEIQKTEREKQQTDQSDGKDNQSKPEEETKKIDTTESECQVIDYFKKIELVWNLQKCISAEKDESVRNEAKVLIKNVRKIIK